MHNRTTMGNLIMRNEKMRSEEEIRKMIKQIDEVVDIKDSEKYDRLCSDKDFKYCLDIKANLQWVLKKMSMGQEIIRIEEEMRDIDQYIDKMIDEKMKDDELEEYIEFMDREFFGAYKNRDIYDTCNVSDTFSWALGEESNECFISSAYINLEDLRKKVDGYEPICIERTGEEKTISLKEIDSKEKEELLELIDQMTKLRERIYEIRKKGGKIRYEKSLIQAQYMKDISLAKDEKGKIIYRNKDSRAAELILRLKKDGEYQGLDENYGESSDEENRLSTKYNRLVDRKAVLTGVFFEGEKISVY